MRPLFISPIKTSFPLSLSLSSYKSTTFLRSSPLLLLLSSSSSPPPSFSLLRFLRSFSGDSRSSSMATAPPPRSTTPSIGVPAVGAVASDVGISRRSWNKFKRDSIFSLFTPFVLSLAAGNLRLESFRHYISQDVHFLQAFAHAYELSEECADDDDDKIAISELRKNILKELHMHDSYVQEWGIDLGKEESSVNSATQKYIDFLLATASGKVEGVKGLGKLATPFEKTKIAAYTLGAMTPCMRLYAFLGKELKALADPDLNTHPYKKWIDNYSSEGFQACTLQIEELLDKLSASLTGEELDVIEKLYKQAMKLETEFFGAQTLSQKTVAPLWKELNPEESRLMLFSDFDLTCTVVDSSAILAEIAIVTAPKFDQSPTDGQITRMSSADLRNTWGVLSRQYTEEYEQCIENVLSTDKGGEFNFDALQTALELLADFEKKANARVIDSGVLKGVNLEDIRKAGERIILQDGCTSFFQNAVHKENLDVTVHVLSYCWCGDLIRSAFSSGGLDALNIHANEFNYEESISTGEIIRKVESPIDKLQAFDEILVSCGDDKKNLSVYIGDSVGDLLCLLKADIGIVVGSSSSLKRLGSHFGVSFVPLFEGLVKKQRECVEGDSFNWKAKPGVLYTASSWSELHAFILGC
ncbi:bifunctional TH2 protein, mitochondrial-like [Chenopodium quinoa]|nr:bifunctional TH2 protein, mitochondrial-like [Chenopodium quinoa]